MVISEDHVHQGLNGHVYTMQENIEVAAIRRRRHSAEFKAEAVNACKHPGVSVAAVALHYRLNANLLRRWIAQADTSHIAPQSSAASATPAAGFIPLQLPMQVSPAVNEIVIEVKRGGATVTIRWPYAAASECASWLQGWLR
jgi:transposase-like protein